MIKDTPDNPSQTKAIVEVAGAHDITITGFTIEGPCIYHGVGCIGYGVEVDNGGSATVDSNDILDIRDDPLSGNQNGWAIGAIGGSVTATSNLIKGYQKAGIKMTGAGTVDTITGNTIVGAGDMAPSGRTASRSPWVRARRCRETTSPTRLHGNERQCRRDHRHRQLR